TDAIDAAGRLPGQHGADIAAWPPAELIGSSRIPVKSLDVFQSPDGENTLVKKHISASIQDPGTEGVQDGMQGDVALQRWGKRQPTGNAELVAQPFPAAQQAAVMRRTEWHAQRAPVVLKEVQRGGNPEIGKREMCFGLGMEC